MLHEGRMPIVDNEKCTCQCVHEHGYNSCPWIQRKIRVILCVRHTGTLIDKIGQTSSLNDSSKLCVLTLIRIINCLNLFMCERSTKLVLGYEALYGVVLGFVSLRFHENLEKGKKGQSCVKD